MSNERMKKSYLEYKVFFQPQESLEQYYLASQTKDEYWEQLENYLIAFKNNYNDSH